jgi:hypothetical protein
MLLTARSSSESEKLERFAFASYADSRVDLEIIFPDCNCVKYVVPDNDKKLRTLNI